MPLWLPFRTFGEAAVFDFEVDVSCRCLRQVVIEGTSDYFKGRCIMTSRFVCTTILPHGQRCNGAPSVQIRKRGRGGWTISQHSQAIRIRQLRGSCPEAWCS